MQRVPESLFENADKWAKEARSKLDKFEENLDKPNFINYDLLETKDSSSGPDIINFGESLVTELDEHKEISMSRVASQIKQLQINFNHDIIGKLNTVVATEVVEGVEIDENELASMEEMLKEASHEPQQINPTTYSQSFSGNMRSTDSRLTDATPITRNSLANLTGDDNDLLSESPVFAQAVNNSVP